MVSSFADSGDLREVLSDPELMQTSGKAPDYTILPDVTVIKSVARAPLMRT
jgi:hypothetical protein